MLFIKDFISLLFHFKLTGLISLNWNWFIDFYLKLQPKKKKRKKNSFNILNFLPASQNVFVLWFFYIDLNIFIFISSIIIITEMKKKKISSNFRINQKFESWGFFVMFHVEKLKYWKKTTTKTKK